MGRLVPGWDRGACRVRSEQRGRTHFSWGDDARIGRCGQLSDAGGTVGHIVKLRFYLHQATLYGFQAGDASTRAPPGTTCPAGETGGPCSPWRRLR
jgi:hypothetical protein